MRGERWAPLHVRKDTTIINNNSKFILHEPKHKKTTYNSRLPRWYLLNPIHTLSSPPCILTEPRGSTPVHNIRNLDDVKSFSLLPQDKLYSQLPRLAELELKFSFQIFTSKIHLFLMLFGWFQNHSGLIHGVALLFIPPMSSAYFAGFRWRSSCATSILIGWKLRHFWRDPFQWWPSHPYVSSPGKKKEAVSSTAEPLSTCIRIYTSLT